MASPTTMVVFHCYTNFRIVLRKVGFLSKEHNGNIHCIYLSHNVCQSSLCIKEEIKGPEEYTGPTCVRCSTSEITTAERETLSYYHIYAVLHFGIIFMSFDYIRCNKREALLYGLCKALVFHRYHPVVDYHLVLCEFLGKSLCVQLALDEV